MFYCVFIVFFIMSRYFLPLVNYDNRCATNSAYQALLATDIIGNLLNDYSVNDRDNLLLSISRMSDYDALTAFCNILDNFNREDSFSLLGTENNLTNDILNDENVSLLGIISCSGSSSIERNEHYYELKSAIYCSSRNNRFGHFITLIRENEGAIVCNDLRIHNPREENVNETFFRFPSHFIESGTMYYPVCYFYEKVI